MSKDRLEEIREIDQEISNGFALEDLDLNTMTVVNRDHFEWLIEQAELAQELERLNKQLKNNLSVYKGYYKNMIKINEDIVEENKKYRNLIKDMGREIEVLTDVMSNADNADGLNEEVIILKGMRGYGSELS